MLRGDRVQILDGFSPLCHIQHPDLSQARQDPDDSWGGRLTDIVRSSDLDLPDRVVHPAVGRQKVDYSLFVKFVMNIVEFDPGEVSKATEPGCTRPRVCV